MSMEPKINIDICEVARLAAQGNTYPQIAKIIGVTKSTLYYRLRSIKNKGIKDSSCGRLPQDKCSVVPYIYTPLKPPFPDKIAGQDFRTGIGFVNIYELWEYERSAAILE